MFICHLKPLDLKTSNLLLDDISLVPGACPNSPVSCTFTDSYCDWVENLSHNNRLWSVGLGRVANLRALDFNPARVDNSLTNKLYADFTANSGHALWSAELLSPLVDSPAAQGSACFFIDFAIGDISQRTDTIELTQVEPPIAGRCCTTSPRTVSWATGGGPTSAWPIRPETAGTGFH